MAITFLDSKNFRDRTVGVATGFPVTAIPPGEEVGDVSTAYDEFNLTGIVIPIDAIIKMMFIPLGARITESVFRFDAMGASAIVDIGFIVPATGDLTAEGELHDGVDVELDGIDLMTGLIGSPGQFLKITESTTGFDPAIGGVQIGMKFIAASIVTTGQLQLAVYSIRE